MEAPDFEAAAEIEAVGGVVAGPGIEGLQVAAVFDREGFQVVHERGADALRAVGGVDDEVVDFEILPAPDFGGDPGPGEGDELAIDECADGKVVGVFPDDALEAVEDDRGGAIGIEVDEESGGGQMVGRGEEADVRGFHAGKLMARRA